MLPVRLVQGSNRNLGSRTGAKEGKVKIREFAKMVLMAGLLLILFGLFLTSMLRAVLDFSLLPFLFSRAIGVASF